MKSVVNRLLIVLVLIIVAVVFFNFYTYIFARTVSGVVENVDRVSNNMAIIGTQGMPAKELVFSFAVAIKQADGEIVTASSEDRQWAVVEKGKCAEAKFYPYPPWELDKSGTFHNARLIKLYDCPK
jgi:hypothetical protein